MSHISPVLGGNLPTPGGVREPHQRPKHKRTHTGFGVREIKAVEASIPEQLRETCVPPTPPRSMT